MWRFNKIYFLKHLKHHHFNKKYIYAVYSYFGGTIFLMPSKLRCLVLAALHRTTKIPLPALNLTREATLKYTRTNSLAVVVID